MPIKLSDQEIAWAKEAGYNIERDAIRIRIDFNREMALMKSKLDQDEIETEKRLYDPFRIEEMKKLDEVKPHTTNPLDRAKMALSWIPETAKVAMSTGYPEIAGKLLRLHSEWENEIKANMLKNADMPKSSQTKKDFPAQVPLTRIRQKRLSDS